MKIYSVLTPLSIFLCIHATQARVTECYYCNMTCNQPEKIEYCIGSDRTEYRCLSSRTKVCKY